MALANEVHDPSSAITEFVGKRNRLRQTQRIRHSDLEIVERGFHGIVQMQVSMELQVLKDIVCALAACPHITHACTASGSAIPLSRFSVSPTGYSHAGIHAAAIS